MRSPGIEHPDQTTASLSNQKHGAGSIILGFNFLHFDDDVTRNAFHWVRA